ncbi:hypothetical protein QR680_014891 [Steinernema hermaphroditum]|uniref:Transcription initiation factor TFIID subunit 8 n=1 Tax=Steinernema hermaphroditum TaxID=289476 RepID=A0AA39ID02_9BILA|nr:hypothetical protein QR680_014891 [Steinernema hermaphroditum]
MKSLFVAAALLAVAFACTDLKDNVVKIANIGSGLNVEFEDVLAATYDSNHKPACASDDSSPSVETPGIIRLVSGKITVKKAMSLEQNSDVLATLQKDSFLIGKVCENGESKNFMVPSKDCHINLCAEAGHLGHADLCKLFETPGTHTLGDLKGDLKGFNGTVAIPPITGMIKNVLKGSWKAQFTLVQGGETLANVKVPANEEWIDVEAMKHLTVDDLFIASPEDEKEEEDVDYTPQVPGAQYDHVLRQAIAVICSHEGFTHIDADVFDFLFHSVVNDMTRTCASLKAFTEGAGRTVSTPHELMFAFAAVGTDVAELQGYFEHMKTTGHHIVIPPVHPDPTRDVNNNNLEGHEESAEAKKLREEKSIPDWMPPIPPIHTFRRTEVEFSNPKEYDRWRRQQAQIHRDSQMSLVNYLLRTRASISLFREYEEEARKEVENEIASQEDPMDGDDLGAALSSLPVSFNTLLSARLPLSCRLLIPREDEYGGIHDALGADDPEPKFDMKMELQRKASAIWNAWREIPPKKPRLDVDEATPGTEEEVESEDDEMDMI